jgi:hypothetical protein
VIGQPFKATTTRKALISGAMLAGLALAIALGARPAFAVSPAADARGAAQPHAQTQAQAHTHEHGGHDDAASLAARQALLILAEAQLAQGDAASALRGFEQAAQSTHEAEIELGILRAQMQLGDYRHALAFAAHTAGVHLDEVEGRVFYAWMLGLGAQAPMAERTLGQAEAVAPQHPLVRAVRQNWASGHPPIVEAMRQGPARLAPYAWGSVVPEGAGVVATGTLLPDGRHALLPLNAALSAALSPNLAPPQGRTVDAAQTSGLGLGIGPHLWLRNGLGQTVTARLIDRDDALGVALLRADDALPAPPDTRWAPRDAFAGAPLYALDQAVDQGMVGPGMQTGERTGQAAWPLMRPGFLGRDTLGVDWPVNPNPAVDPPRGGPVLDAGGRLIGVSQRSVLRGQPADRLLPASALRQRFGDILGPTAAAARAGNVDADALYEAGMRLTLQVIVAP